MKRADLWGAMQRQGSPRRVGVAVLVMVVTQRGPWLAPIGIALGIWMVAGSLSELAARIGLFHAPLPTSLSRLSGLPGAAIGMSLAHAGVGIMIAGIIAISVWKVEVIVAMKPGETAQVGDYSVCFGNAADRLTIPARRAASASPSAAAR
jgi:cytochrome c-type biogenesis protein CcmF